MGYHKTKLAASGEHIGMLLGQVAANAETCPARVYLIMTWQASSHHQCYHIIKIEVLLYIACRTTGNMPWRALGLQCSCRSHGMHMLLMYVCYEDPGVTMLAAFSRCMSAVFSHSL